MLSWIISSIHLLTLGLGLGSAVARGRALSKVKAVGDLSSVFQADNLYGAAAFLWISTGVWRAFGGLEKGTNYYLGSSLFWIKMMFFGTIFFLEIYPMITLMKWRKKIKKGDEVDLKPCKELSNLTYTQVALISIIVFVATAMARNLYY